MEPPHDVAGSAICADIFCSRQLLTQEAIEVCAHLTISNPARNSATANAYQDQQGQESKNTYSQPYAPVDAKQQEQYTNQQDNVAQQVYNELRKEVGERIHISVDAFDKLDAGMRLVRVHVQCDAEGDAAMA